MILSSKCNDIRCQIRRRYAATEFLQYVLGRHGTEDAINHLISKVVCQELFFLSAFFTC